MVSCLGPVSQKAGRSEPVCLLDRLGSRAEWGLLPAVLSREGGHDMRSTFRSSRAGLPQPRAERQAPTEGAGVPGSTGGTQTRLDGRPAHAESTLCVELAGIFMKSPGDASGPPTPTARTGGAHPAVWSLSPVRRRWPAPRS